LTTQQRVDLFLGFPESMQDEFWAELERDFRALREYEWLRDDWDHRCLGVDGVERPNYDRIRHSLRPQPVVPDIFKNAQRSIEKRQAIDDALLAIPTADYIEKLAGVPVDKKAIYCPLPDHDDRNTPNFYVYEYNWRCYACGAQGRIYQFAALIWGYSLPLRGQQFNEVFERLASVFRLD
jgi:hypothetical protein